MHGVEIHSHAAMTILSKIENVKHRPLGEGGHLSLVETSRRKWCAGKELKKLTLIWSFHRIIMHWLSVWRYLDLLGFTAGSSSSCRRSLNPRTPIPTHTFTIILWQSPNQRVKCTQGRTFFTQYFTLREVIVLNTQKGGGKDNNNGTVALKEQVECPKMVIGAKPHESVLHHDRDGALMSPKPWKHLSHQIPSGYLLFERCVAL